MIAARWMLLPLIVVAASQPCPAANPQPQVRTSIAEQEEIWVGQRVTLVVELLTPGTFASSPSFDLPQIPNVVLIPPRGSPTVGMETIDDTDYTTQRHELAVFAQRAGDIEIPAFAIRFASAAAFGKPAVDQTVQTKPVAYKAKMPPGAAGLSLVITTSDLTVTQDWDPKPTSEPVQVGAAFTRTITIEASEIPAMVLPAFPHDAPQGLGAYPRPPAVEDKSNRGVTTGRRVDAVTFVCESPGAFELPALAIAWWNPQEHKLNRVELPGQRFEVAPSAPNAKVQTSQPNSAAAPWIIGAVLAAGGLVAGGLTAAILIHNRSRSLRNAEAESFAKFEEACRKADPRATLSALFVWLDQLPSSDTAPGSIGLTARGDDPAFAAEVDALETFCYGRARTPPAPWSAKRLLTEAKRVRHRWKGAARGARSPRTGLSPLNP